MHLRKKLTWGNFHCADLVIERIPECRKVCKKKINKWQVLIFQENIKHLWLFSSFLENMKTLMAVFKFCRKYKKSFYWSQVFCEIKNSWLFWSFLANILTSLWLFSSFLENEKRFSRKLLAVFKFSYLFSSIMQEKVSLSLGQEINEFWSLPLLSNFASPLILNININCWLFLFVLISNIASLVILNIKCLLFFFYMKHCKPCDFKSKLLNCFYPILQALWF